MKEFLSKKIEVQSFSDIFFDLSYKDQILTKKFENNLKKFEKFSPDSQSRNFATFITNLLSHCKVFESDSALRKDYQISEEKLRNYMKKTLLQL